MIINAKIDNFMGIKKEINISFISNNKIKRNNNVVVSIDDNLNLLKSIGIIGSNASGKTSIIKAFYTIQTFINFPFRKSKNSDSFLEHIKQMPDELASQLLKDFNLLSLPSSNENNKDTIIEIECFVPEKEDNISGIYTYKIIYNNNYANSGITEESLYYRKKYTSTKIQNIFKVENIIESDLGTKLLYKNNTLDEENSDELMKYYTSFGDEIKNFEFSLKDTMVNILKEFKNNQTRFKQLCNLADNKIIDVIENKNIEKRPVYLREYNNSLIFINSDNKKLYYNQLSEGTQKIINLGSKILNSIEKNKILFIDELENSLHNSLSKFLLKLSEYNKPNTYAQMLFTTHSLYLSSLLDNDQLYFINQKNKEYSLSNIVTAIKDGIILKDKNIINALSENLLIDNPSDTDIECFLKNN